MDHILWIQEHPSTLPPVSSRLHSALPSHPRSALLSLKPLSSRQWWGPLAEDTQPAGAAEALNGARARREQCSRSVAQSHLTSSDSKKLACQAPPSMGFSWQKYWTGLPFPISRDLSNPGIEPTSPASPVLLLLRLLSRFSRVWLCATA